MAFIKTYWQTYKFVIKKQGRPDNWRSKLWFALVYALNIKIDLREK